MQSDCSTIDLVNWRRTWRYYEILDQEHTHSVNHTTSDLRHFQLIACLALRTSKLEVLFKLNFKENNRKSNCEIRKSSSLKSRNKKSCSRSELFRLVFRMQLQTMNSMHFIRFTTNSITNSANFAFSPLQSTSY